MKSIIAIVCLLSAFSSFAKEPATPSDRQVLCAELVRHNLIADADRFSCLSEAHVEAEEFRGKKELSATVKNQIGSEEESESNCTMSISLESNFASKPKCEV